MNTDNTSNEPVEEPSQDATTPEAPAMQIDPAIISPTLTASGIDPDGTATRFTATRRDTDD